MKSLKSLSTQDYQHIGYLLFAVAASDKNIDEKEVNVLKLLVKNNWLNLDDANDSFGSDAAYQIEIVFDWLVEADWESDTCFTKFEDYYKEHSNLFSEDIKSLIIKIASTIAESYAGKNKSELIILAKIKTLLKQS